MVSKIHVLFLFLATCSFAFPFPDRRSLPYRSTIKILTDRKDFELFKEEYIQEQSFVKLEHSRINALDNEQEKAAQLSELVENIKNHFPQPKHTFILIDALLRFKDLNSQQRGVVHRHLDLLFGTHTQHNGMHQSHHAINNDTTWLLYKSLRHHSRWSVKQKMEHYQELDRAFSTQLVDMYQRQHQHSEL